MKKIHLHSVAGRILVGKLTGLILGAIIMLASPSFGFPIFSMFGIGTLLMFIIMGAMIGFLGQFDRHPAFDFKISWWMRGILVGGMIMLMYVLLSYNSLEMVMESGLVSWMGLESPFWALLDGVFVGLIMSGLETKIAGEGTDLPLS